MAIASWSTRCSERGHWAALEPSQAGESSEAVLGPRPMAGDDGSAGAAHDRAKHEGDDDRVVGVAEQRHEVGYEVDREREIAEHSQSRTRTARGTSESPANRPSRRMR